MDIRQLVATSLARAQEEGVDPVTALRRTTGEHSRHLPPGFDDSDDVFPLLQLTRPAPRRRLEQPASIEAFNAGRETALEGVMWQPQYRILVRPVLTANDDGTQPNQATKQDIFEQIDQANKVWQAWAGITFAIDPDTSFAIVKNTKLNQDYPIPSGLTLTSKDIDPNLSMSPTSGPYHEARQDYAKQLRGRIVVFFGYGTSFLWSDTTKKWEVSPRYGGYSWSDLEYVKMAGFSAFYNLFGHEVGHFLHLIHTHGPLPATMVQAADQIRQHVASGKATRANGLSVFDGDVAQITDTTADPGPSIFSDGCTESPPAIVVDFKDGTAPQSYQLKTDQRNIMSYFKHCQFSSNTLSGQQQVKARTGLQTGNRHHLISVQIGESGTPSLRFDGVWTPSTSGQSVSWGKTRDQHNALYGKWWNSGFRLIQQQAYVVNGQLLYDGIWNPNTGGQFVSWGKTRDQHVALYAEWWNKGFRLIHQQAYVVAGQLLYDGIWNPNTSGQFVSWGKTRDQHVALYAEWWNKGFRLIHQQAYVVNGQLLYDGIWNPNTSGQFASWGKPLDQHAALYGQWWNKGFRLGHQQSYLLGGQIWYDGIWNPSSAGQFVSWFKTREMLAEQYAEWWNKNFRLMHMSATNI